MQTVTASEAQAWLVEKLAVRLEVEASEIDVERYFDEFDLDSTEALILAGELEKWLGFELEATALWYHPTVAALSEHIAEESANHVAAA
ncbi:acyl carrier protein [Streptomyces sp. NE06-03E]|uniref:Acyl carrier protein n=3 Tax=Streptomyces TaxID=1883 RepID=A0AAU1M0P8_9ACTN|nr:MULTISPECIES: acyl carrier protein [Streptomyces]WSS65223.1 acyl carrier protein [Streptomyces sp. NBC_01177]WSS72203.1 acyl carrier protein [Streptomyces sp. NBC_01175]WSS79239.1 acyl carrier protein [Streptomyces sp. NBC_01174]MBL1287249.1 acyl carrier protein [Streptomyces silvae]MDX3058337.1 acyl carrier protein [Streptomyces sp. NE06-03E]